MFNFYVWKLKAQPVYQKWIRRINDCFVSESIRTCGLKGEVKVVSLDLHSESATVEESLGPFPFHFSVLGFSLNGTFPAPALCFPGLFTHKVTHAYTSNMKNKRGAWAAGCSPLFNHKSFPYSYLGVMKPQVWKVWDIFKLLAGTEY